MIVRFLITSALISMVILNYSCKKYLDAKPDQKLVVPTTIKDLQALLDNPFYNNQKSPSWDEASSDNYYLNRRDYNRLATYEQKGYVWEDFERTYPNDWSIIYDAIYYANVALEGIDKIKPTSKDELDWNNVKGSALFHRALSFHRAALMFSNAYDEATASQNLGIVLRQTSDFNAHSQRANAKDTYDKIIVDLKIAATLLPDIPKHVMRPSKTAAYALLARTYLSMRKYDSCFKYADLSLQIKDDLMDYNTEADTVQVLFPFKQFNKEIIFSSTIQTYTYTNIAPGRARVNLNLYNSYSDDDLRKKTFYTDILGNGYVFQGTYDGTYSSLFVGIATDEVWLMRAESNAQMGNKEAALSDLNALMVNRWRNNGSWTPFIATTAQEALSIILTERRKELVFRGLRWMDIKRLNKEGSNIVLTRTLPTGETFNLQPNDLRYALLIPSDIINLTSMPQNPR